MVIDRENKIAYIRFPADKEEVSKARAENLEIIDILFKPTELTGEVVKVEAPKGDPNAQNGTQGNDQNPPPTVTNTNLGVVGSVETADPNAANEAQGNESDKSGRGRGRPPSKPNVTGAAV